MRDQLFFYRKRRTREKEDFSKCQPAFHNILAVFEPSPLDPLCPHFKRSRECGNLLKSDPETFVDVDEHHLNPFLTI